MSSWKQRKNTTKLPKALREELISLGQLDPHRKPRTSGGGWKGDRKTGGLANKPYGTGSGAGRGGSKPAYRPQPKVAPARSSPAVEESSNSDEELLDEEDRRIAELEKKLGMNRKQKANIGDDDLDGLLADIGTSRPNKKRKRESQSIKPTKDGHTEIDDSTDSSDLPDDMSDIERSQEESEFEGFSETSESPNQPSQLYVATSGKYIPPAARKSQQTLLPAQQEDPKLRKQIQGVLNRLSESNMSTILGEIETLYRTHPRANVTSALTTLLLTILSAQQTLLDTFVILHAGFVAALYRLIGTDFGAHLIQTLVERFDEVRKHSGKESTNLVTFLSELYNFGVVGAGLIYDLIRTFLEELNENDTELLLKVVQNSGQQLRQDDPSALKDIVILMQSKVASQDPASLTVRTKFMTETIINLKNNRAKAATSTSVVTSEATIRMKKFLGKMGEKNLRSGGEPLRVTLNDIRNVNEKGKWWLVGASWKNDELPLQSADQGERDGDALISLARAQRMNTEIRRAVFIALMGSEDYVDASTRIILLPLKKAQRNEIPRVLVHCCSNESVYNPFYALVARRLCSPSSNPQITRVIRMGLQFNLWGAFREWGESTDAEWSEEQDDVLDETAKLRKAVNLARLYGTLVAEGVLSLQILKVLGFINLHPLTKTFLEIFFTQLILSSQSNGPTLRNPEPLLQCTSKLLDTVALAKGIEWYLRKRNVEKAGISTAEEKVCIVWGVGILRKGISQIFADS